MPIMVPAASALAATAARTVSAILAQQSPACHRSMIIAHQPPPLLKLSWAVSALLGHSPDVGSTSTSQLPLLSRMTASTPYGRSEGGCGNSTPRALRSS
jgi:hypothetical protein